jgi:hypothetical protein
MTSRQAWSRHEVELIVDDYLDMLRVERRGGKYNKSQHNADLRPKLNNRSRGSIEFKHCNISSVLQDSKRPFINGYKPRANAQRDLLTQVINEKWNMTAGPAPQPKSLSRSNEVFTPQAENVHHPNPSTGFLSRIVAILARMFGRS